MNEELVNQIVQRVLATLRQEAPGGGQAVKAPNGTPEGGSPPGAGRGDGGEDASAPAGEVRQAGNSPPAVQAERSASGRVWLTADALADRARGGTAVLLAANEFLTPAARDYAAGRGLEVRRGGPSSGGALPAAGEVRRGRTRPAVLTRRIGLVVVRSDSKVEGVLASAARGGIQLVGLADSDCPMCNTQAMCEQVKAGELAGGVIVDRYAAAGMVLAAKIKGIRPVQGVSLAAVEAALRQFDANVLVVGCQTVSVYEFRSMLERFAAGAGAGRDRTALLDRLEELEGKA